MILFCEGIIKEIKSARTETQLKAIVSDSLLRYKMLKNSANEASYLVRIIVSLRVARTEKLSEIELKNIKGAIEAFKQYKALN
jgi:hypothetical protein